MNLLNLPTLDKKIAAERIMSCRGYAKRWKIRDPYGLKDEQQWYFIDTYFDPKLEQIYRVTNDYSNDIENIQDELYEKWIQKVENDLDDS